MFCFQICSHPETKLKGAFPRVFFCCNAAGNWSNLNWRDSCKTLSQMGGFTLFLPERFSVIIVGGAAALFGVFQGQRKEIKQKTFCIFPRIEASLSRSCNTAPEAVGVCFCPTKDRYTLDHSYTILLVLAKKTRFWLQLPWFNAVRQLSLEACRSGDRPWTRPVRLQALMESQPPAWKLLLTPSFDWTITGPPPVCKRGCPGRCDHRVALLSSAPWLWTQSVFGDLVLNHPPPRAHPAHCASPLTCQCMTYFLSKTVWLR